MAEPRRAAGAKKRSFKGTRILIVEARFYDDIADALLEGATRALDAVGASYDRISVPGSLEIPPTIAIALGSPDRKRVPYDAAVGLGCVIRGETLHFEIVSFESARALMDLSVSRRIPIGNGIITVDTDAQARERADVKRGDKGGDAARAALALLQINNRRR
ncbi:MAG: 6,7-dimethyl-8-ribityllumazine synthase [Xanthobacteraceae bacterium]